jgi:hypothetical protein
MASETTVRATSSNVLAVLAATLIAGLFVPSASAISGELRVLYVLATWGPMPFTQAEVESVAAETDALFRASSAGRFAMPGTVAGPIRIPRAVFGSCDATVLRNAAPATTFAGYDRVAFVTPVVEACRFAGEANPTEVLLNGRLFTTLAAHELGHTLGLGHASRWDCAGSSCTIDEYGNEFSVMGGGRGDLNAYEKASLDWLTGVIRPTGSSTYEIGPIEGSTTLPQALVIRTAASEFWFESRREPSTSLVGDSVQQPGVVAVAGPAPEGEPSPYPRENVMLANPNGGGRHAYASGESFVEPGIFRLRVERHSREGAALGFEWLDRTAPTRPRLRTVHATGRGRVQLSWEQSLERGSGVETYTLLVDGRAVRSLRQKFPFSGWRASLVLSPGWHRVAVFATDRAANRSRAAWKRVRVT